MPENIFKQCDHCHESIPYFSLIENDYVCPKCGHHMKISARQRIRDFIDEGSWREYFEKDITKNIENFPGYDSKLKKAQMSTGMNEAVICGIGKINQSGVVLCVMDSRFMMGSMGKVVGEKICKGVELASRKKLPLIISCTSGGARMQEGIDSLMQMAKISAALKRFSNQGGLYIALLTHPTTGGVSASFAMLGDIIIAEPQAMIGFAGKRVIQDTIKQELPEGFQTAEFLLEKGFIDMIVQRHDLKNVISDLLKLHGGKL
ncbi:acetyl-CoA carboxylase, carboxyltransferase subunit beta [Allocoprobacillus halotolerans]|uniref:Acetyl-coenzyme A carboxylase carboxyl transferase subunit beta n=1 Tax=Allocoprobacillus halotolerans TaxID=2944914 RepID=A0ABY5I7Z9_9FIRM|nr:acetyl-CoA carboxylase, carboxyltransferase subunit beta [Allocoprobacillus halotolerans]UTY40848.1 acetyl-CoA carboxylase, carboxyltransferase subunit beta [Allocoprobacillus halotolerans]